MTESSPTSEEELSAQLQVLLFRAYENGIDVEGAFECRNGASHPDWDAVVTEVEKNG